MDMHSIIFSVTSDVNHDSKKWGPLLYRSQIAVPHVHRVPHMNVDLFVRRLSPFDLHQLFTVFFVSSFSCCCLVGFQGGFCLLDEL